MLALQRTPSQEEQRCDREARYVGLGAGLLGCGNRVSTQVRRAATELRPAKCESRGDGGGSGNRECSTPWQASRPVAFSQRRSGPLSGSHAVADGSRTGQAFGAESRQHPGRTTSFRKRPCCSRSPNTTLAHSSRELPWGDSGPEHAPPREAFRGWGRPRHLSPTRARACAGEKVGGA